MARSVPLSRSTLRVGGGSAFFVRPHSRMTFPAKLWDFLLGALAIGTAPGAAYFAVGFLLQRVAERVFGMPAPHDMRFVALGFVLFAIDSAAALVALLFVCRWRMKHRLLPASVFWVEMLVGLAAGGVFFLFICAIYAMADPNW